jgi:hypothetical protein
MDGFPGGISQFKIWSRGINGYFGHIPPVGIQNTIDIFSWIISSQSDKFQSAFLINARYN